MLAIAALAFVGVALLIAASAFAALCWAAVRSLRSMRPTMTEPRVIKGELVFDHAEPGTPEVRIFNSTGLAGFIDSNGVMRTERGSITPESFDSPEPLAVVLHLPKRQAGE